MRKKKNKPASLIVTSELLLSDQIILGFGNHICRMRLSILLWWILFSIQYLF